jgi:hypothetical protein
VLVGSSAKTLLVSGTIRPKRTKSGHAQPLVIDKNGLIEREEPALLGFHNANLLIGHF